MASLTTRLSFSDTTSKATLADGITSSTPAFNLNNFTGFPNPVPDPFEAIIGRETAKEEEVLVTGVSGNQVTVLRAQNGTTAVDHDQGDAFEMAITSRVLRESNEHTSDTVAHGAGSDLVGKDDQITMTGKTLSGWKGLATSSDPAVKGQAAAAGTAQLFVGVSADGSVNLFQVGRDGGIIAQVNAAATTILRLLRMAGQTSSFVRLLHEDGSTELARFDVDGKLRLSPVAGGGTANLQVKDDGGTGLAFEVIDAASAQKAYINRRGFGRLAELRLDGFGADDVIYYPSDGSKFRLDTNGSVVLGGAAALSLVDGNANNVPTTPGATGLKLKRGSVSASLSNLTATGTISFGAGFTAAPVLALTCQDVDGNVAVAASFHNLTSSGCAYVLTQTSGANVTRTLALHWIALGV